MSLQVGDIVRVIAEFRIIRQQEQLLHIENMRNGNRFRVAPCNLTPIGTYPVRFMTLGTVKLIGMSVEVRIGAYTHLFDQQDLEVAWRCCEKKEEEVEKEEKEKEEKAEEREEKTEVKEEKAEEEEEKEEEKETKKEEEKQLETEQAGEQKEKEVLAWVEKVLRAADLVGWKSVKFRAQTSSLAIRSSISSNFGENDDVPKKFSVWIGGIMAARSVYNEKAPLTLTIVTRGPEEGIEVKSRFNLPSNEKFDEKKKKREQE